MGQTPCLPCQGPRGKHVLCHSQQSPALSDIIQHPINYPWPPLPLLPPILDCTIKYIWSLTPSPGPAPPAHIPTPMWHSFQTNAVTLVSPLLTPPPSSLFPPFSTHAGVAVQPSLCWNIHRHIIFCYIRHFFFPSSELDVTKRSARIWNDLFLYVSIGYLIH